LNNYLKKYFCRQRKSGGVGDPGFTLMEIMVVMVMISIISAMMFTNFRVPSKSATARKQTISVVLSDIRRVQSQALSGNRFQGVAVCGFGIHYVSNTSYLIYSKPPLLGSCSAFTTRNYQSSNDISVQSANLSNSNMKFVSQFADVYFEMPDPKTYVNNVPLSATPNNPASTVISIGLQEQADCSSLPCNTITIYNSGKIDSD
jgi:prepilin-type N-terminal cleavage/methylation domain-containing protein